ncbi:tetratricopeptide repeat protein [bacterium]|nr:tetratricopeptide repeat protein [bacterium]
MKCNDFSESILDIHYHIASPEVVQAFHHHSKECPSCQAELSRLQEISLVFSTLPQKEPTQATLNAILEKSKKTSVWSLILSPFENAGRLLNAGLKMAPIMMGLFVGFAALHVITNRSSNNPVVASNIEQSQALKDRLLNDQFNLSQNYPNNSFQLPQAPITKTAFDDQPGLFNDDVNPFGVAQDQLKQRFEERKQQLLEADADSLMMRGRRLKAMGRIDLALADFETIYQFHPTYTYMSDVLMYRAQCYAIQGHLKDAIDSLNEIIARYPDKKDMVLPMIDQLKSSQ